MGKRKSPFALTDLEEKKKEVEKGVELLGEGLDAVGYSTDVPPPQFDPKQGMFRNPSGQGRWGRYPWHHMVVGASVRVHPDDIGENGRPLQKFRVNVSSHNTQCKPKRWIVGQTEGDNPEWRLWRVE